MGIKRAIAILIAAGLGLTVVGCTSAQPTTEGAQETAQAPAEITVPTVDPGTPELPVVFTGDDGAEVEVSSLERVMVLDDATLEIAHALGVGDTIAITPEESLLQDLASQADTRVTTAGQGPLTVEGIVALEPTLVVADNLRRHGDLVAGLRAVGVPAVLIDTSQPAPDKIRKTAEVFGVASTGDELASAVEAQIDAARDNATGIPDEDRPSVMVISSSGAGDSGATTAAGQSTPAHEIIVAAGARNAGAESGLDRYQSITAEGLIAAKPDIIIVRDSELADLGGEDGIWTTVPGLSAVPAADTKALIVLGDTEIAFSGVSTGRAVLTLQAALFPEL
ncbi:hemin ABC transporter substrate-binding protein [Microbacterium sp.]|uniref:heme/hemin ABC transporter substrate-binding protein n=1 Tax=Microbacterium sp. TaxID=51671 RepID=UPI0035691050